MNDKNQAAAPPAATAEPAPRVEQQPSAQKAEPLSRRLMFGAGLVGVAAFLAQACASGDFASGGKGGRKDGDGGNGKDAGGTDSGGKDSGAPDSGAPDSGQPDASGGDANDSGGADNGGADAAAGKDAGGTDTEGDGSGDGLGTGEDSSKCYANTTAKLDTAAVPEAGDDLKPRVKFYGTAGSTMIAMKFPSGVDIKQIIVTRDDGTLLALHGITAADKKGADYRPIVVDNLNLGSSANVIILVQQGTDRKKHTEPVAYFKTYNNKPVVDLSAMSVPADWAANQSVTQFAVGAGFKSDPTVTYPNDFNAGQVRSLQTAQLATTWVKKAGVKGTVTDIMGDTINIDGAGIIDYQLFCTYVDVGANTYRTVLHIG